MFQTPPKFHEKTPRETQKERNDGGRGKKSAKLWAVLRRGEEVLRSGARPIPTLANSYFGQFYFYSPTFPGLGPTLRGPTLRGRVFALVYIHQHLETLKLAKVGAEVGLAKCGHGHQEMTCVHQDHVFHLYLQHESLILSFYSHFNVTHVHR